MSEPHKLTRLSLELDTPRGSAQVVVDAPFEAEQRVLVVGPATEQEVRQALERLGLDGAEIVLRPSHPPGPGSATSSSHLRAAARVAPPLAATTTPDRTALAALLERAVIAVLRVGRRHQTSSVDESLEQLRDLVETHQLPALARLVTRLRLAIASESRPRELALLLAAALHVARLLRDAPPGDPAVAELVASSTDQGALGATTLLELARCRERQPLTWETRLLLELTPKAGALYREEAGIKNPHLSRGLCGRLVTPNLGSRLEGMQPCRIRVYQYEYHPSASTPELRRASECASPTLPPSDDSMLLVTNPLPVFLRPKQTSVLGRDRLRLDLNDDAVVARDEAPLGACRTLVEHCEQGSEVLAVAGRLALHADGLSMEPWSALLQREGQLELVALSP